MEGFLGVYWRGGGERLKSRGLRDQGSPCARFGVCVFRGFRLRDFGVRARLPSIRLSILRARTCVATVVVMIVIFAVAF